MGNVAVVSGVLAQVVAGAGASASGCGNECEWLRVWVRGGITGKGRSGAALLEKMRACITQRTKTHTLDRCTGLWTHTRLWKHLSL